MLNKLSALQYFQAAMCIATVLALSPASMRFHLVRTPVLRSVGRGRYALLGG